MKKIILSLVILIMVALSASVGIFVSYASQSSWGAYERHPEPTHCQRWISFRTIDTDDNRGYPIRYAPGKINYGGYSECELIDRAWLAYSNEDYPAALDYVLMVRDLYSETAKKQGEFIEAPRSRDRIKEMTRYNALAVSWYIEGGIDGKLGNPEKALQDYQNAINSYPFAKAYDFGQGKEIDVAQEAVKEINELLENKK